MRTLPFGLSRHEADWAGVLSDPVFEDVLAERRMRLQLAAAALQEVQAQVGEIAEMIERRLTEN